jgi:peptidyl-prolyl cis-trans isomerase C
MSLQPKSWPQAPVFLLIAVVFFAALAGCNGVNRNKSDTKSSIDDPIVAATVNGKPIYITDVESEAVVRGVLRSGEELDENSDSFYQILEDLIERRLFSIEAESRQLDRSDEVRRRLERAREVILEGALNEQLRQTALDSEAIEKMYKENARLLKNDRTVHARHIMLPTKDSALAAKRRLSLGEGFEALAYEVSIDRDSAAEGGDLGFILPEQMPDGFREALTSTPIGQVTEPVQTQFGWHLIKIDERREEAPPSLERMRPQIERWLMFQQQRQLIAKLKTEARIERVLDGGENRGVPVAPEFNTDDPTAGAAGMAPPVVPMGPGAVAPEAPDPLATPAPAAAAPSPAATPAPRPRPSRPREPPPAPAPAPTAAPPSDGSDNAVETPQ